MLNTAPWLWLTESVTCDTDECLVWPFGVTKYGRHGYAIIRSRRTGKQDGAYRVAWELAHEREFPAGMDAGHSCGNGDLGCVNWRHVRPLTRKQNMEDARVHGTLMEGAKSATAVLDEWSVRAILRRHAAGDTGAELARRWEVSETAIYDIVNGRTWKHLPRPGH